MAEPVQLKPSPSTTRQARLPFPCCSLPMVTARVERPTRWRSPSSSWIIVSVFLRAARRVQLARGRLAVYLAVAMHSRLLWLAACAAVAETGCGGGNLCGYVTCPVGH